MPRLYRTICAVVSVAVRALLLPSLMDEPEHRRSASVDHLTEEVQMLVHVLRMIAGKSRDPDVADELVDLADTLDQKVDQLREAVVALLA